MKRLLLLAPLLLLACPKPPTVIPNPFEEIHKKTLERMHVQFGALDDARAAVIRGDLDAARAAGKTLANLPPLEDPPSTWVPRFEALGAAAHGLEDASTLPEAGLAVGKLAAACSSCHRKEDGGPPVRIGEPPAENDMQRHDVRLTGMWLALLGSEPAAFQRISRKLADAERYAEPKEPLPEGFLEMDESIHQLAKRGADAAPEAQAEVFGELLATCSGCHAVYHGGPQ